MTAVFYPVNTRLATTRSSQPQLLVNRTGYLRFNKPAVQTLPLDDYSDVQFLEEAGSTNPDVFYVRLTNEPTSDSRRLRHYGTSDDYMVTHSKLVKKLLTGKLIKAAAFTLTRVEADGDPLFRARRAK